MRIPSKYICAKFAVLCVTTCLLFTGHAAQSASPSKKPLPTYSSERKNTNLERQMQILALFQETFAQKDHGTLVAGGTSFWDVSSQYNHYCTTRKGEYPKGYICENFEANKAHLSSFYKTHDTMLENDFGIHHIETAYTNDQALSYTNVLGRKDPEFSITVLGKPTTPLIVSNYDPTSKTVVFELPTRPYKTTDEYIKKIKYHFIDKDHVDIELHEYMSDDHNNPMSIEKLHLTRKSKNDEYNP